MLYIVGVKASIAAEFLYGEEVASGFAQGGADAFEQFAGMTLAATGDALHIFGINAQSFLCCFHTLSMLYPRFCYPSSI